MKVTKLKPFFNISSHNLTQDQKNNLPKGCNKVIELPENLKKMWGSIPAEEDWELLNVVKPILDFIEKIMGKDFRNGSFLVQGEPATVMSLVLEIQERYGTCYCALTSRESQEVQQADGSIRKVAVFRHKGWRKYPKA